MFHPDTLELLRRQNEARRRDSETPGARTVVVVEANGVSSILDVDDIRVFGKPLNGNEKIAAHNSRILGPA